MAYIPFQLYSLGITVFIGIITGLFAYIIYRRHSVILWGFLAGILPDLPSGLNFLGLTDSYNLLIVTHIFGVFLITVFLVLVDMFLIELKLLRFLYPIRGILAPMKPLFIAYKAAEKLEAYNAIPSPERLQRVYVVSLVSIIIHLSINLILGVI
jgi:hypothetical protein